MVTLTGGIVLALLLSVAGGMAFLIGATAGTRSFHARRGVLVATAFLVLCGVALFLTR